MADFQMGEAQGKELTDETEGKLTEDLNPEVDAGETGDAPAEPPEGDLPEGLTEPDADKGEEPPAEPSGESEVDRLKRLGVFKPGLVESFDDLAKSYQHANHLISTTRRAPREETGSTPGPDATAMINDMADGLMSDDPKTRLRATFEVANVIAANQSQRLREIDARLFQTSKPDYTDYAEDVDAIMDQYPGMPIEDAYNMALGKNRDNIAAQAAQTASEAEKRRETDRQQAIREKAGAGVRTGTGASVDVLLNEAAAKYQGEDLRREMAKILRKSGQ